MVHWTVVYDLQTPAHVLYLNEVNTVFLTIYLKVMGQMAQPHLSISIPNDKNCCWFLSHRHDLWYSWNMSFTIINTASVLSAEELNPLSSNLQRQQVREVATETHIFQLSSLVKCAAWLVKLLLFAQLSQQGRPHNQEPHSPCTNPPLATLLLGLVKNSTYPAKVFQHCACSIVYFT